MPHTESDEAVNPLNPRDIVGASVTLTNLTGATFNKVYTSLDGGYTIFGQVTKGMDVVDAIRDVSIEIVPAVESFDGATVSLSGGRRIEPDVVIAATGYLHGLEPLVGHLDVLDERGVPLAKYGEPAATGLRFLGFLTRPSLIGSTGRRSKQVAREIADELSAA